MTPIAGGSDRHKDIAAYDDEIRPDGGEREQPPVRAGKERLRPPITGDTTPVAVFVVSDDGEIAHDVARWRQAMKAKVV